MVLTEELLAASGNVQTAIMHVSRYAGYVYMCWPHCVLSRQACKLHPSQHVVFWLIKECGISLEIFDEKKYMAPSRDILRKNM